MDTDTTAGSAEAPAAGVSGQLPLRAQRLAPVALAVLCVVVFVAGVIGIDYGVHWDEPLLTHAVSRSFQTGLLLPRWYEWPSMCYHIALVCTAPEVVNPAVSVQEFVLTKPFSLRLRAVFLFLSLGALVWTYLLVVGWRGSRLEALLAAAFLGTSWEMVYHARWVATDGLFMQFGVLTMLLVFTSLRSAGRERWLAWAAIAAGVATGTKYQGGLLLLPVFVAAVQRRGEEAGLGMRLRRVGKLLGLYAIAFVLTTPGSVMEPTNFLRSIRWQMDRFAAGHWGHSVAPGLPHMALITTYLGAVAFSRYWVCALGISALMLAGVLEVCRRSPRQAALFLLFPVVYVVYFATQRVMFVKNLVGLLPFLAVCAGIGAGAVYEWLRPRRWAAGLFVAVLLVGIGANVQWLVRSSLSVRLTRKDAARQFAAYASARGDRRFLCTAAVLETMRDAGCGVPGNVAAMPRDAAGLQSLTRERVVFFTSDLPQKKRFWLPRNQPGLYLAVFGPHEMNVNYYPDWLWPSRLIVVSAETAKALPQVPRTRPQPGKGAGHTTTRRPSSRS